jgi:hypothetical protein
MIMVADVLIILLQLVWAGNNPAILSLFPITHQSANNQGETIVRGTYHNYNFAYSVRIPNGLVGFKPPPPLPQHGFGIDLSKQPKSYFWVDASYNALNWESFDEAISANLRYIEEDGTDVKLIRRSATTLGGLQAVRFVIQYKVRSTKERIVQEMVLAFRRSRSEVEMTYEIGLTAPEARYKQDREVIAQIQKSWRLSQVER